MTENRIDRYRTLIGDDFVEYDKEAWFKEAIDGEKASSNAFTHGRKITMLATGFNFRSR